MRPVQASHGTAKSADGLELHYHAWDAPAPRAGLVVVHGLAEHGARYAPLGQDLAGHGVTVLAMDLRGHGRSTGTRGHAPSFAHLLDDVARLRAVLVERVGVERAIGILGHSMGGLIAIRCAQAYPASFDHAVLIAPWLGTAMPVPRWKTSLAAWLSRALPGLPIPAGIEAGWLSRDPAAVREYEADPLVHDRITPRLYVEAQAAIRRAFVRPADLACPALFLLAGGDRIVSTSAAERFAAGLPGDRTTVRVYDGHYHELLNEPDAAEIRRTLRDWLDDRIEERDAGPDTARTGARPPA